MNTSSTLESRTTQRRNSNGWLFRDLNNRSPAHGGLNKSRWGEFARDEVKTCRGDQLRGIAVALGLPEPIVGRAALASMGLTADTTSTGTLEDIVRAEYHLTDHDRRIPLAAVRDMRTESTHGHDTEDHEQEPRTQARGTEPTQPTPITRAGVSPAHEDREDTAPPVTDEYALAAYDAPSEGRKCRRAQDAAAEGSQETSEWGEA